jgi:integrase
MLNDTLIRSLKPIDKPKKYYDGGGLFLYIPTTGSKLWRMAYRYNGKSKLLSFGEYPTVSLKSARERREEAKRLLAEDIDPSQHKKSVKAAKLAEAANSFKNIALEWHGTQTLHIKEPTRACSLYRLNNYLFPHIGGVPIAKLEAQDILAIVKPLEEQGLLDRAHYLIQLCGRVLRYAIATGKAKHNVAADLRGAIRTKRPKHHPTILDKHKIGKLLLELDGHPGYFPVKCALRLMPLVFVRERELIEAEWAEFDLDAREWRIPARRMKMGEQHIVPLSRQAMSVLEELRRFTGLGQYLFPSARLIGRPIGKSTMLAALRRKGYKTDELCTHGFRSMASTLLNELGFNSDWIERQLAHTEQNSVRAAYNYAQYLPERRRMMQEWSDYLDDLREKARQRECNA